jgi:hypothetical protein
MYALYEGGAFGNKLRTWASVDDYFKSAFTGLVVMRYSGLGNSFVQFNLARQSVPSTVAVWLDKGAKLELIKVSEAAPDHRLTIQGELMQHEAGYSLFYSTEKTNMRLAMANRPTQLIGPSVMWHLKALMTPGSYADTQELLDIYPGAVIEFSTFSVNVGHCSARNTIVWEVRSTY